jgi:hypothetical protein
MLVRFLMSLYSLIGTCNSAQNCTFRLATEMGRWGCRNTKFENPYFNWWRGPTKAYFTTRGLQYPLLYKPFHQSLYSSQSVNISLQNHGTFLPTVAWCAQRCAHHHYLVKSPRMHSTLMRLHPPLSPFPRVEPILCITSLCVHLCLLCAFTQRTGLYKKQRSYF